MQEKETTAGGDKHLEAALTGALARAANELAAVAEALRKIELLLQFIASAATSP